ncbi:MAG: RT0821/Lpp0805 family surface protein [Methylibium sp.]|uniref:RT0821/Lpp0805 family surface protein n=1 Tax=Methylibium sp. TaxID=2067992 RepID=UPI002743099B|nr:RT0821/Lpp0805 family surface protein [Methylibium sp.]
MRAVAAFAMLTGLLIGPAQAAGENAAMKDRPISRFGADDYALMKARVDQAIKAETAGGTLEWKNDKSGASGSVTPLDRLEWQGMACRRLQITNVYGHTTGKGVYRFCQQKSGAWKLVGPDGAQR